MIIVRFVKDAFGMQVGGKTLLADSVAKDFVKRGFAEFVDVSLEDDKAEEDVNVEADEFTDAESDVNVVKSSKASAPKVSIAKKAK